MPLPLDVDTLRALLDRLIPADDYPSATAAGVDEFVFAQLRGDCAHEARAIELGLAQLDHEALARFGVRRFAALSAPEQDVMLSHLERGETRTDWPNEISAAHFFDRLVNLAHEGFYADPANGGNRDAVAWSMVRYHPRMPPTPS